MVALYQCANDRAVAAAMNERGPFIDIHHCVITCIAQTFFQIFGQRNTGRCIQLQAQITFDAGQRPAEVIGWNTPRVQFDAPRRTGIGAFYAQTDAPLQFADTRHACPCAGVTVSHQCNPAMSTSGSLIGADHLMGKKIHHPLAKVTFDTGHPRAPVAGHAIDGLDPDMAFAGGLDHFQKRELTTGVGAVPSILSFQVALEIFGQVPVRLKMSRSA